MANAQDAKPPVPKIKDAGPFEANCCHMPRIAPISETQIYERFRNHILKAHCADKRPGHRCAGKITLDCTSITLQCPRCGDAKAILTKK